MEALFVILLFVVILAIQVGIDLLIAWGLQWCLASILGHAVPFWPVFIGVFLLSCVFRVRAKSD